MDEHFGTNDEVINRLIKLCHKDKESAEKLYQEIIVEKKINNPINILKGILEYFLLCIRKVRIKIRNGDI